MLIPILSTPYMCILMNPTTNPLGLCSATHLYILACELRVADKGLNMCRARWSCDAQDPGWKKVGAAGMKGFPW